MPIPMLEAQVQLALEKISNGEQIEVKDEWIDDAAEMFKAALKRQLRPAPRQFYVRMSNVGRPSCQLQMEKAGAERSRFPYNHVIRMLLGDATEAIMEVVLRTAGVNITGGKSQVSMDIAGVQVKGENDIEIDDKVFDTKSASPWAFTNKFADFETLKSDDSFGYIPQLIGYSLSQGKKPGGWIVVNKASGEVKILEVDLSEEEIAETLSKMATNVAKISTDAPFERCFEPEEEKFRGKPTGNLRLGSTCSFCPFLNKCWPDAVYKPQTGSQAQSPKYYWYAKYAE
jgi:hypothetical protein